MAKSQLIKKSKNVEQHLRGRLSQQKQSPPRKLSAFDDCLVMTVDTIDQIKTSIEIFEGVEWSKIGISPLNATQRLQMYNLLSAAKTNVETCLDGFSHSRADKKVQADVKEDLMLLHRAAGFWMSVADGMGGKDAKEEKRRRGGVAGVAVD